MRIPQDEQGNVRAWTLDPKHDALLYFVQLMHELVSHQSPESLRPVSLDSYHRLVEIERSWKEATAAGFPLDLTDQIDELLHYLGRDPVITQNNVGLWKAVSPCLRSASSRPDDAIDAIRLLSGKLAEGYLRQCRDHIEHSVTRQKARDKRRFRFLVENYCSHLLNLGYRQESIFYRIRTQFFEREVTSPATRELQDFFSFFPRKAQSTHTVGFAVTPDFESILSDRSEFSKVTNGSVVKVRPNTFSEGQSKHVFAWTTTALDAVDARAKGESHLTTLRSIAYTATPFASMQWDPHVVVVDQGGYSVVLREQLGQMRQGRWSPRNRVTELEARIKFFLDDDRAADDRNRLLNSVTSYAGAFHSESLASQLLSLWSSLEGILPAPKGTGSRIDSFARAVRACYTRLYFARQLAALDFDLYGVHREAYSEILAKTSASRQDAVTRLASLMCITSNAQFHVDIGKLCATNPLGRQRLFELHDAGKNGKTLYAALTDVGQKVEWQLRRIYRERNRIVHRASPSENLGILIQTLNAYILCVFDALVRIAGRPPAARAIDDIFAEIRIMEEARQRIVADMPEAPLDFDGLDKILGPER